MGKNNHHSNLFNASGCVLYTTLQRYANHRLPDIETKLVEQHLDSCPLCHDALEGILNVQDQKTLPRTFNRINENLRYRIRKKHHLKIRRATRNQRQKKILLYSAAASVIILIGIFGTLNYQQKYIEPGLVETPDTLITIIEKNNMLAENINKEVKSTLSPKTAITVIANMGRIPPKPATVKELKVSNDDEIILEDFETPELEYSAPVSKLADEMDAEEPVFFVVETMPSFQDGDAYQFREYIARHLRYPEKAMENGIEGRVIVQFVVNKQGKTEQIKIVKSVDPILDEEATRIIKNSPDWQPGFQRGKPVNVQFTIPITFRLN